MRVITWNCRRASAQHALWESFNELDPDIAVLQEVGSIPESISAAFDIRTSIPRTRTGKAQRFISALLVKGFIGDPVPLRSNVGWANGEPLNFGGNLFAYSVKPDNCGRLTVVCVYSPAWALNKTAYVGNDISGIKLTQSPDIWVADLLVSTLRSSQQDSPMIIAGDFNLCESFDKWRGGPHGNREYLDRMTDLGFNDCLRHKTGILTPTFRKPGKVEPHCQIDYLFANKSILDALLQVGIDDPTLVYEHNLSDHLPIVVDFEANIGSHTRTRTRNVETRPRTSEHSME